MSAQEAVEQRWRLKRPVLDAIFEREDGLCFWCDEPTVLDRGARSGCRSVLAPNGATIDHIIPKRDGGPVTVDNAVLACRRCNEARGSRPADVWLMIAKTRMASAA